MTLTDRREPWEKLSPPAHGCPMYPGCWLNAQPFVAADTNPIDGTIHFLVFGLNEDVPNMNDAEDFKHIGWRRCIDWQDRNFIGNVETFAQICLTHDRLPRVGVFGYRRANLRPDKVGSDLAIVRSEFSAFAPDAVSQTPNLDAGRAVVKPQHAIASKQSVSGFIRVSEVGPDQ